MSATTLQLEDLTSSKAASDDLKPSFLVEDGLSPTVHAGVGTAFGKLTPVSITVRNLSVAVNVKSSPLPRRRAAPAAAAADPEVGAQAGQTATLVEGVYLTVPSGTLMAIMGGSGSGKTTLLNALAGRATGKVSGEILFNGGSPRRFVRGGAVAYVQQQDSLLPYLTVRDTLKYAARLRLPRTMSSAEKDALVESVILELGLKECASTLIGDEWRKGISGGEKRRVSVGVQLLLNPSVIFMDEPTTGLDSFSARSLVETLSHLCARGRTIVISIHQPRSDIFTAFDHITLLTRGRLAYSGPRAGVFGHFADLGHEVDGDVNGADFLIDVTSVDTRSEEVEAVGKRRVDAIVAAWSGRVSVTSKAAEAEAAKESEDSTGGEAYGHRGATFWQQVAVLTRRAMANMIEDRVTLWGSVIEVVFLGLIMGSIFYQLDQTPAGILSRKSILYSVCALQNYLSLMFITFKLCKEMQVFDRERADKMYSAPAYLVAWYSVNTLLYSAISMIFSVLIYFMVGLRQDDLSYHFGIFALCGICMQMVTLSMGHVCVAISREFATASLIGNSMYTFISMSSGFFIAVDQIPVYLRWFSKVSFITFGLEIFATNEFQGHSYACPGLPPNSPICQGDNVIAGLGFDAGIKAPFISLAVLFTIQILAAGLLLQFVPQGEMKQAGKVGSAPPAGGSGKKNVNPNNDPNEPTSVSSASRVEIRLDDFSFKLETRSMTSKKVVKEALLLDRVNLKFQPGKLTAILGASGAGKSTLLQLLHARQPHLPATMKSVQSGQLLHNNHALDRNAVASITASVRQDDSHLLPALTARETLRYAAMLRLRHLPRPERVERAELVLRSLGLRDCGDTVVGGNGVKGLSGGEKRRLSVGLAMLTDPAVLLLDEPTSGLDAFTARGMVELLASLAAQGRTVVCTIHQPRSDLFPLFEGVVLLARGGRVVYEGPGRAMAPHFAQLGYKLPPLTNPADFALDLSSVDLRAADAEVQSRARVETLVDTWRGVMEARRVEEAAVGAESGEPIKGSVSSLPLVQALPLLVARSFRNLRRQAGLVSARIAQSFALGAILTMYFVNLKKDQASVTARIGFLQQCNALVFIGMLNCIAVFPQELALFRFEHQDGAYSVDSFFWTYTINEVPFEIVGGILFAILSIFAIGLKVNFVLNAFVAFAMISQPGFSVQIMSAIISVFSIMAGFLSVSMPAFLTDFNYLSILRYTSRAQAIQEFNGLTLSCDDPASCQFPKGEDALNLLGFDSSTVGFNSSIIGLIACVVAYRLMAFCVMKIRL
ncbi:hypothetical protein HK101_001925 [Irineochytrium annulatum]|nr:hypothetical protein HK101_001925 [Irineochytrium annulatum]